MITALMSVLLIYLLTNLPTYLKCTKIDVDEDSHQTPLHGESYRLASRGHLQRTGGWGRKAKFSTSAELI